MAVYWLEFVARYYCVFVNLVVVGKDAVAADHYGIVVYLAYIDCVYDGGVAALVDWLQGDVVGLGYVAVDWRVDVFGYASVRQKREQPSR